MKIIEPYFTIETPIDEEAIYRQIEQAGRTCYKSEGKIGPGTAAAFVRKIIASGHESVLEHVSLTFRFICDRGVSHELVRHRIAAFSQESTRYCNYSAEQFGREITVIRPPFWSECDHRSTFWENACREAELSYIALLDYHATPQEARAVLPNSLKTEVVMTANLREWRHVLRLRTSPKAHPQMRQLMCPLLEALKKALPAIFEDLP